MPHINNVFCTHQANSVPVGVLQLPRSRGERQIAQDGARSLTPSLHRLQHLEILDRVPFDLVTAYHERAELSLFKTPRFWTSPGSSEVKLNMGAWWVLPEAPDVGTSHVETMADSAAQGQLERY